MKPLEEQKTITIYKCADCGKEHGDSVRAEQCCACCTCLGPTTAEDKKFARGGSQISTFYRRDLTCEWCRVRKEVKTQQDLVRRYEQGVEHAKRTLEGAERELAKEQKELETRIAKRDALPPKPRSPKEKREKEWTKRTGVEIGETEAAAEAANRGARR